MPRSRHKTKHRQTLSDLNAHLEALKKDEKSKQTELRNALNKLKLAQAAFSDSAKTGPETRAKRHADKLTAQLGQLRKQISDTEKDILNASPKPKEIQNLIQRLDDYSNLAYLSPYHLFRNNVTAARAIVDAFKVSSKSAISTVEQLTSLTDQLSALTPKPEGETGGILHDCIALMAKYRLPLPTTGSSAPAVPEYK